jgi:hypothetical protein
LNIVAHRDKHSRSTDDESILVVNEDRTVTLMDLEGNVRWRRKHDDAGPARPTTGVGMRSAELLGIVDGYGTSTNFLYRVADGTIAGSTGCKGCGEAQSNLNHGVDVDPAGNLVVSDRDNTRLTWWSGDGFEPLMRDSAQVKLDMPGLEVCNVSFLGRYAAVPCLNSKIVFLGPDENHPSGYQIVSVAQMPKELVDAGIDGIHDAVLTNDGRYVVVAVWERHREQRQIPTLTAFRIHWGDIPLPIAN